MSTDPPLLTPRNRSHSKQLLPTGKTSSLEVQQLASGAPLPIPEGGKKYKATPSDPVYIKGQLPPDSLVGRTAYKQANAQGTSDASPPDKKSK